MRRGALGLERAVWFRWNVRGIEFTALQFQGLGIRGRRFRILGLGVLIGCKLSTFWGSSKVVDSESFNFYFLGLWASEEKRKKCRPLLGWKGFDCF